jgi:hypothetical protein
MAGSPPPPRIPLPRNRIFPRHVWYWAPLSVNTSGAPVVGDRPLRRLRQTAALPDGPADDLPIRSRHLSRTATRGFSEMTGYCDEKCEASLTGIRSWCSGLRGTCRRSPRRSIRTRGMRRCTTAQSYFYASQSRTQAMRTGPGFRVSHPLDTMD